MSIELNTNLVTIPNFDEIDWPWPRILCTIEFVPLFSPTSLQWALLSIILNINQLSPKLHIGTVAENLGIEISIVEEGLLNLIDSKFISLQSRQDRTLLDNYTVSELVEKSFLHSESTPGPKSEQKFFIYHKPGNKFSYQQIDQHKGDELEPTTFDFSMPLLAVVYQLFRELQQNQGNFKDSLFLDLTSPNMEQFLNLDDFLVLKIHVNFL